MTVTLENALSHPSSDDPDPAEECVAALREIVLAGEQYRFAAATYLGVSITDSQAISYLLARGPMEQHELAIAMGMTAGSITSLVDRLCNRGLVERAHHPTDRRRSIVRLSDHGRVVLGDVRVWMNQTVRVIDESELPATAQTLRTLAASLRAQALEIPEPPETAITPRRRR